MSERISPQDEADLPDGMDLVKPFVQMKRERDEARAELDVLREEVERLKAENQELNDVIRWNA